MDLRKARKHSTFKDIPHDRRQLVIYPTRNDWLSYIDMLYRTRKVVAVDIEAAQPGSHITRIGLSHTKDFGMSIPIYTDHDFWTEDEEVLLWTKLGGLLSTNPLVFHNACYDISVIWKNHGIWCEHIAMDTLIAAHCYWPEAPRDLGFLASICLDVNAWKHTAKADQGTYNSQDACNTYGISQFLDGELEKLNQHPIFYEEMKQIFPASTMMLKGIAIDTEWLECARLETQHELDKLEEAFKTLTGEEINLSSPKQVQKLLYIDRGLPVQYKRRKSQHEEKKITVDEEAMEKLYRKTQDPVLGLLLKHRKLNKLLTTYLNMEVSPNERVYTSYIITGSSTEDEFGRSFGRWSSSRSIIDPWGSGNLQNIPSSVRKPMYLTRVRPSFGRIINKPKQSSLHISSETKLSSKSLENPGEMSIS